MGLDQYLYAKQYLTPSEWAGKERNETYDKVINAIGAQTMVHTDLPSATVGIKVGYWRKVNAIHQWFVDNCQNGVDECQEAHVSREQLEELLATCKTVVDNHSLCDELLPTQGGFFFGSTEYDDYYFSDIEDTVEMLTTILQDIPEDWDFTYQSSW